MSLKERITEDMKAAMRARETQRLRGRHVPHRAVKISPQDLQGGAFRLDLLARPEAKPAKHRNRRAPPLH